MNRKHVAIIRWLCRPGAFLVADKRSNGSLKISLVEKYEPTKLSICKETLLNWISLGYITTSGHTATSYIITESGRALIARLDKDELDLPLTMTSVMHADQSYSARSGSAAGK
jgi:hypothetical protein